MKVTNTIVTAALIGLLFSGSASTIYAQANVTASEKTVSTENKLSVLEVKPMQFRVSYNKVLTNLVIVRILDTDKNVLFSESKRADATYLKYFDLSTLLDGTYTFEVTDGKEKYSQSFDILTKTSRAVSSIN